METLLTWLGAQTHQHRRAILIAWLAILGASVPFALGVADHLTAGGFEVSGSQSQQVNRALARHFPRTARADLAVLLWPRRDTTARMLTDAIEHVHRAIGSVPDVTLPVRDYTYALFGAALLEPTVLPLTVAGNEDTAQRVAERLRSALGIDRESGRARSGIELHLLGEGALAAGLNQTLESQLGRAETLAVPALLVVLLAACGSLAAATLPLLLGMTAVVITSALIYFLSLAMGMSVFVTNTASMLGIGVAVDYSLIMVSRVREELRAGREEDDARSVGLRHAGRAVIFSGTVVIGALSGLLLVPSEALRSMAIGAIMVVAVSGLVTVVLIPVLVQVVGARRLRPGLAARGLSVVGHVFPRAGASRWYTWVEAVIRHRRVALALSVAALGLLAAPVLALRTQVGALRQLGKDNETRIGFAEAEKLAGPGAFGPTYVVIDGPRARQGLAQAARRLRAIARGIPDVKAASSIQLSGTDAFFSITPSVDPEARAAKRLVARLHVDLGHATAGTGVHVAIGGTTATQVDEEDAIASSMWKVIAVAAGIALILLLVLFRSVILAALAVVMNLAAVAAAYGVLVVVFQWGWLGALVGFHSLGYVNTLTLPLVLAIVFGLSMDYEVFVLSRVRERWLIAADAERAIVDGIAGGAQTITSAAVILMCVFGLFAVTGIPSVKELGVGAAVAIGVDASLIRLILAPASMSLLSKRLWSLPAPLRSLHVRQPESAPTTADPT